VNIRDETSYRLALADGFLQEAEQDFQLERWRSCVDNAQLAVENSGKAVLTLFGAPPKTHDPAKEISALLHARDMPDETRQDLIRVLPDLLALGAGEHFPTDYGDEATYTLPWELFTRKSATEAITSARRSVALAKGIVKKRG
jgi:HEPN domain-containing protein